MKRYGFHRVSECKYKIYYKTAFFKLLLFLNAEN